MTDRRERSSGTRRPRQVAGFALRAVAGGLLFATIASAVVAGGSKRWTAPPDPWWQRARLDGVAVSDGGVLRLAPALDALWGPDRGVVFDLAAGDDGDVFVALSEPARVVRVTPEGKADVWYEGAAEAWVTAVAVAGREVVFATAPDGVIHRVRRGGAEVLAESGARYVWDLAVAPDGAVWAAVGSPGRVLRIDRDAEVDTVVDTGDDPVRSLHVRRDGSVVAGTGRRGRVLAIDAEARRAVTLLDAPEAEIVALVGSTERGRSSASAPLWVLAARDPDEPSDGGSRKPNGKPSTGEAEAANNGEAPGNPPADAVVRVSAGLPRGGGALYRLDPDGRFERLWEENVDVPYAAAVQANGTVWVGVGDEGRIVRIDRSGKASIAARVASAKVTALAATADGGMAIGATEDARLLRASSTTASVGVLTTLAIDAGWVAEWGRVEWVGRGDVGFELRSGNTTTPELDWSPWAPAGEDGAADIAPGRFAQLRITLSRDRVSDEPEIRSVALHHRVRNRRPTLSDLGIEAFGVVWRKQPTPSANRSGPWVADDPVSAKAAAGLGRAASPPVRKAYEPGVRTFTWKADDPDRDALRFRVDVRAVDASAWYRVVEDHEDAFLSWDTRGLPDGEYLVRVVATDLASNTSAEALEATLVGAPFIVDRTAPAVHVEALSGSRDGRASRAGRTVEVVVEDAGSGVAAFEFATALDRWTRVEPEDGVADLGRERFVLTVPADALGAGSTIRVRAVDRAGNVAGHLLELDGGGASKGRD